MIAAYNVQFRKLTVRDMNVGANALAMASSVARAPSFIDIVPVTSTGVVVLDGIYFRLEGTRSGSGNITARFVRLSGLIDADVCNVTVDCPVSGMTTSNDQHHTVAIGDVSGSTVRASLHGIRTLNYAGSGASAANVHGVILSSTSTLTIPAGSRIIATGCDFSGAVARDGSDYNIDSTQRPQFVARDIAGQRTSGGSGPPTGRTAITLGGSPYTYTNSDPIIEDVIVTGGTVSKIEFSDDGTTFRAIADTSWGTLTSVGGCQRLGPGQQLRVTYSAAPTMEKFPAK